jgi:hypothetical protein
MTRLRSALWLPIFDDLAEPAAVARLAAGSDRFGDELRLKPLRRAARHDGFFPVNLEHPDQLADIVTTVTDLRQAKTTPYDFAIPLPPGADPAPYAKAGATWWLVEFSPETVSLDQVRGVLREGPVDIDIERTR